MTAPRLHGESIKKGFLDLGIAVMVAVTFPLTLIPNDITILLTGNYDNRTRLVPVLHSDCGALYGCPLM